MEKGDVSFVLQFTTCEYITGILMAVQCLRYWEITKSELPTCRHIDGEVLLLEQMCLFCWCPRKNTHVAVFVKSESTTFGYWCAVNCTFMTWSDYSFQRGYRHTEGQAPLEVFRSNRGDANWKS